MSHASSLLFPSHLSTTSLSTCTPVRLSTSHGDILCEDPPNVSFASLHPWLNRTRLQVKSPKISLKRDTSKLVKPMFFHRASKASTYDSLEHCDSPSCVGFGRWASTEYAGSTTVLTKREASADRSRVCHSFRENSMLSSSHFRESAGKPAAVFSHQECRVKRHVPTEKAFPQDINHFTEKTKLYPDSADRKILRE